jgi:alpha-tubulin suppressor-like RCC1 family protein
LSCWGSNQYGQLGDGTRTSRLVPTQVGTDRDWVSVSAGFSHTCGLRGTGTLWCWGYNYSRQLGDGTSTNRRVPTRIGTSDWAVIRAGNSHTVGLQS